MNVRDALKGQYHAAFRMLAACVEACPDELWLEGKGTRQFWRIAYHAAYFGHLYMVQSEAAFKEWSKHCDEATDLWGEADRNPEPFTKADLLAYVSEVQSVVDATIDGLDLDTSDSGYHWYPNISKLEHEILSIRHVQGHVGQLSELLMAVGIDTKWISRRA